MPNHFKFSLVLVTILLLSCSNNRIVETLETENKKYANAIAIITKSNNELKKEISAIQDSLNLCKKNLNSEEWGETKYTHGQVNIRTGRGVSFKKKGILKYGDEVKVDFLENNWYTIFDANETEMNEKTAIGYIRSDLLFDVPPTKKIISNRKSKYTRTEIFNICTNIFGFEEFVRDNDVEGETKNVYNQEYYKSTSINTCIQIVGHENDLHSINIGGPLSSDIHQNSLVLSEISNFAEQIEKNSSKWINNILSEKSYFPSKSFEKTKYFGEKKFIIEYSPREYIAFFDLFIYFWNIKNNKRKEE